MHAVGLPSAFGAIIAAISASPLGAEVSLALGGLSAFVGVLLALYVIVAGFDRKLVEQLQREEQERFEAKKAGEIEAAVGEAQPELRATLQRIIGLHASIESAFADGIDDQVEAILVGSRDDLKELRDRAIAMAKLHLRLYQIVLQSDGRRLYDDLNRMTAELERTPDGAVRDALESARQSTERTYKQWLAAMDKQAQIRSVLTVIETNLQEFKLAMELRKADAAMGQQTTGPDVTELQQRLVAAGQACDELVGGSAARTRRRRRA
jgi:hypothetical protein